MKFFSIISTIMTFCGAALAVCTINESFALAALGVVLAGIGTFLAHLIDRYENPNHYPPKY